MRLALGTVQFGLDYGISNHDGKVNDEELDAIIALARQAGIDTLDTAQAYGNAEQRLGLHIPTHG
ncbi:aldo/keto reductase, partial [Aeromonas caviae]|uniref:aldo/keto reductase n=1 Tax=Aeromonas caviae TaxID=648 RepID=UPI0029D8815D